MTILGLPPRTGDFSAPKINAGIGAKIAGRERSWIEAVGADTADDTFNRVTAAFAIGAMLEERFRAPKYTARPSALPDDDELLEALRKVRRSQWAAKSEKGPTTQQVRCVALFGAWRSKVYEQEVTAVGRLKMPLWALDLLDGVDGVDVEAQRATVDAFVGREYGLVGTRSRLPAEYPHARLMLRLVRQTALLPEHLRVERREQ